MTQKQSTQIFFFIGVTLTLLGAVAHLFEVPHASYVFSAGSALLIYFQAKNALDNRNAEMRLQRLSRIGFTSSLLLALAAYFMFTGSNLWVVAVFVYALTTLFLSFRGE
jgi:hypothetical protein